MPMIICGYFHQQFPPGKKTKGITEWIARKYIRELFPNEYNTEKINLSLQKLVLWQYHKNILNRHNGLN